MPLFMVVYHSTNKLVHTCVTLQGEMAAMFLRHEGFLGALGAFLRSHELHVSEPQPHTPPAAAITRPAPPSMDTVEALQTGWSARDNVADYAGAIGGVGTLCMSQRMTHHNCVAAGAGAGAAAAGVQGVVGLLHPESGCPCRRDTEQC